MSEPAMEIGTWFGVRWVRRSWLVPKRKRRAIRLKWSAWGRKSARRKRPVR